MDLLQWYLTEDLGKHGDITSNALFTNEQVHAHIIAKEPCIISGLEESQLLFNQQHCKTKTKIQDGSELFEPQTILELAGPARGILRAERLSLNMLGRMSGIATQTQVLVKKAKMINPTVKIMGTRKTTPGFRKYEKKAVIHGGGNPHRYGLYDAVLIKDNHIKLSGSVKKAIETLRQNLPKTPITIEVETEQEALTAAEMHAEIIMLDNFNAKKAQEITQIIHTHSPTTIIECSGGITKDNIADYAEFADQISIGMLTHSVKNIDFSLEFT